ncbi:hypothetical protein D9M68_686450 [compost metagenome]
MEERRVRLVLDLFQLADLVEVEAGGEMALATRQDDDAHVISRRQAVEDGNDFLQHGGGERVAFVGTIDGDRCDLVRDVEQKELIFHGGFHDPEADAAAFCGTRPDGRLCVARRLSSPLLWEGDRQEVLHARAGRGPRLGTG